MSGFISPFRFLLKSLLQYQALTEGETAPTPNSSCHPPVPPLALAPGPAGAPGLSGGSSLLSAVPSGEDGTLKKPKKERKERGRENGKEECEYWFQGHGRTAENHKEQNSLRVQRNNSGSKLCFFFFFFYIFSQHKTTNILKTTTTTIVCFVTVVALHLLMSVFTGPVEGFEHICLQLMETDYGWNQHEFPYWSF